MREKQLRRVCGRDGKSERKRDVKRRESVRVKEKEREREREWDINDCFSVSCYVLKTTTANKSDNVFHQLAMAG